MNTRKTWLEAGLIGLCTAVGLMLLRDLTNITIFQERDLLRASGFLSGNFLTYGPEASGGGFLPGPFYYLLLAIPLALNSSWLSAFYFMAALAGAGVGLAWLGARRFFSVPASMVLVLTLVSMPLFLRAAVSFQNYALLPLFLIGITVCYLGAFTDVIPARRAPWLIAAALSACALQLHGSAMFYVIAGLLMQAFAPWLGLRRVERKTFVGGCLLLVAILAPYYLSNWIFGAPLAYWQSGEHHNVLSFRSFVESLSITKDSLWIMIRGAVSHVDQARTSLFSAPALMTILFVLAIWFEGERRPVSAFHRQLQKVALILMGLSVFPGLFSLLSPGRQRYLICLSVAFAFWLAAWTDARVRFTRMRFYSLIGFIAVGSVARALLLLTRQVRLVLPDNVPWIWFAAAIGSLAIAAALAHARRLHAAALTVAIVMGAFAARTNLTDAYSPGHPPISMLETVVDRIVSETGWTWEQAKERIYLVAFKNQGSFAPLYRDRLARTPGAPGALGPNGVDGYMLIQRTLIESAEDLTSKILRSRVPLEFKRALVNGDVKLVSFEQTPRVAAVGYRITKPLLYPRYFQNVGSSYLDMTDTSVSPNKRAARASYQIAKDETRFVFNDCQTLDPYCDVVYDVKLDAESNRMLVRITGNALAQVESKVSPAWNQLLHDPYVKIKCGGRKEEEKIVLTKHIGHVARGKNTILLAPYTRELAWPCKKSAPIESIAAGWDAGMIARFRQPANISGAEIQHRLLEQPN